MYHFRFQDNIDLLLDGRNIHFIAKEIKLNREKVSKILRGIELCTSEQAYNLVKRCKPNENIDKFFVKLSESEVMEFYGKRNKRPYKRRDN